MIAVGKVRFLISAHSLADALAYALDDLMRSPIRGKLKMPREVAWSYYCANGATMTPDLVTKEAFLIQENELAELLDVTEGVIERIIT